MKIQLDVIDGNFYACLFHCASYFLNPMKTLFNIATIFMLILALFSPYLVEESYRINVFYALLLILILMGVSLGFWWILGVRNGIEYIVSASSANKALNDVLRKRNIYILPIGSGGISRNTAECSDMNSVMTLLSKIFVPSFWLALASLGIAAMAGILLQEFESKRGFFGSLLQSQVGTGLALAMSVYVSFIGVTFFVVGFLAFINQGDAK